MEKLSLQEYKEMFKNFDKEKIIEMNYELSHNLQEIHNALQIVNKFIHLGEN